MKVTIESNNYPSDLRKNNQWVNQQLTWNDSKQKYDKFPRNSRSGMTVKWSNPETWSTIEDAEKLHSQCPDSVPAYIITEHDNLVCIDLDDCMADDGSLKPYAQSLIDLFQSYTERSVSGNGIHIFVQGMTDLKGDVTIIHDGQDCQIEVFSKGRIITMTGDIINDYADIEDAEMELRQLEEMVKPTPKLTATIGQGNSTASMAPNQELQKLQSALQNVSGEAYSTWMSVGMAMRLYGAQNDCSEEAWATFDEWSKATASGNYDQAKNYAAWNSWDTTDNGGKQVTIGTIYHKAREAGWTFDHRSVTAADNGKKGGRPSLPLHADTARECFQDTMLDPESGLPVIRHRDGDWDEYSEAGWQMILPKRVYSRIVTYMQSRSDLERCCTRSYFTSVQDNLMSKDLCGTELKKPSFIDTGECADHWMAFSDGTVVNMLDLAKVKAGQLVMSEAEYMRPVSPAFYSKAFVEYPYEGERSMPLFRQYLDRVQPDRGNQKMLQQMMGLMLCDETRYEAAFALVGSGANGKTVLLDILTALIGRSNVSHVDLHRLNEKFQNFPLVQNRVNICGEMPTDIGAHNLHKVEGILKDAISGGSLEVELKGINKTAEKCRARFIFATNSLPTFVDKSDGIWRRLRIIDFPVTIPEGERDVHLADKIIATERTGVMQWALEGLMEIVRDSFVYESEASAAVKDRHRLLCDKEKAFLQENCEVANDFISRDDLYSRYLDWCKANGRNLPLGKDNFLKRVRDIFPHVEDKQRLWGEMQKRKWCMVGIGYKDDYPDYITYPVSNRAA